ncbi:MAG: SRPBCC family protein [Actinomycetota bacterium]
MKLEHAFEVPASPQRTLALLLDADQVVRCMPGAELVEVVDDRTWRARLSVKLGPVGLDFLNDIRLVDVDEAGGVVRMEVAGRDTRGKGAANAAVTSRLVPAGAGTRVEMDTDLRFSGQAAQLGRPNVVQDVSARLVGQFADCLRVQLDGATSEEDRREALHRAERPVSGLSLVLAAVASAIRRLLRPGKRVRGEGT